MGGSDRHSVPRRYASRIVLGFHGRDSRRARYARNVSASIAAARDIESAYRSSGARVTNDGMLGNTRAKRCVAAIVTLFPLNRTWYLDIVRAVMTFNVTFNGPLKRFLNAPIWDFISCLHAQRRTPHAELFEIMRILRGHAVSFWFLFVSVLSKLIFLLRKHQATMSPVLRATLQTLNASFREMMIVNKLYFVFVFQAFSLYMRDKRRYIITYIRTLRITIRNNDDKSVIRVWRKNRRLVINRRAIRIFVEEKSTASGEILVYLRKQHWNSQQKCRDPSHNHDLACLAYCARILRSHWMHYRVIPETMSPHYSASARSFKLRSLISYFTLGTRSCFSTFETNVEFVR
jgi:hypothetical protein